MEIRIICIDKASGNHENPYTAISYLGWKDETGRDKRTNREEMYKWVKDGGRAYVRDSKGDVAYLIAETTSKGTKYVKTKPDNTKDDNLLKLDKCK